MRYLVMLVLFLAWVVQPAAAGTAPVPLLPEGALRETFEAATGDTADPTWFGAYALLPVGERLYVGLGTARPAEADGALLARMDDDGIQPLATLDEQGFIDMAERAGRIYVPGADPMDGWEAGNLYVHDTATGATTKLRTLPAVIHAWQVLPEADGRLRVAVGRYLPERGAWPWAGGILTSADGGLTWTTDDNPLLGTSRTYDLVEGASAGALGAADVALVDDAAIEGCQLATRTNVGEWQRGAAWVRCGRRLTSLGDGRRVLALGADLRSLVVAGREQVLRLPFGVEPWAYRWAALAGGTLYVLADDGRVMAADNLRQWRTVAALDAPLLSVAYWPARQALVVATRGAQGQVWAVPVGN